MLLSCKLVDNQKHFKICWGHFWRPSWSPVQKELCYLGGGVAASKDLSPEERVDFGTTKSQFVIKYLLQVRVLNFQKSET